MQKNKRILVTGGAGFIGSFLVDTLITQGYNVRIFDSLDEQVHQGKKPNYLNKHAEFIKGDVRDIHALTNALEDIDVVYHLAARVGVGQSNYEIKSYTDVNIGGMANLLDSIVNKKLPIKKIIMTASMTSYGEGDYVCKTHGKIKPQLRSVEQMEKHIWEPLCPTCRKLLVAIATDEFSEIHNNGIYSLTKNVQESMLMQIGKLYSLPVTSLRCFNVYGPRQSLSNPYTGVSAIFISRLKNNNPPVVYEDGLQSRDFVSVHDVVDALIASMESDKANYEICNIGSGIPTPILTIAEKLATLLEKKIPPQVNESFRKNDIRHCFADISKARRLLGWKPKITLEDGLKELIAWSAQEHSVDTFQKAEAELKEKHLL